MFIGRLMLKAEALILWPPDAKSRLIGKDPDGGKDWRHKEKGTTEDEMVRWHHWLNGQESEQTLGDGEGQGSQACCSLWGCKESEMSERLNNSKLECLPGTQFMGTQQHIPWPLSTSSPTLPRLCCLGTNWDWKDQVHTLLEPRLLGPPSHPVCKLQGGRYCVSFPSVSEHQWSTPCSPAACRGQSTWPWC